MLHRLFQYLFLLVWFLSQLVLFRCELHNKYAQYPVCLVWNISSIILFMLVVFSAAGCRDCRSVWWRMCPCWCDWQACCFFSCLEQDLWSRRWVDVGFIPTQIHFFAAYRSTLWETIRSTLCSTLPLIFCLPRNRASPNAWRKDYLGWARDPWRTRISSVSSCLNI